MEILGMLKTFSQPELEEILTLFASEARGMTIEIEQKELEIRLIRNNIEHNASFQRMVRLRLDKLNVEQKDAQ